MTPSPFLFFSFWNVICCFLLFVCKSRIPTTPATNTNLPEFICLCPVKTCLSHACLVTNWAKKRTKTEKKPPYFSFKFIEFKDQGKKKKNKKQNSTSCLMVIDRHIGHQTSEKNLWCSKDSIACKVEEVFFSALCFSVLICVAWGWPHLITDARWES